MVNVLITNLQLCRKNVDTYVKYAANIMNSGAKINCVTPPLINEAKCCIATTELANPTMTPKHNNTRSVSAYKNYLFKVGNKIFLYVNTPIAALNTIESTGRFIGKVAIAVYNNKNMVSATAQLVDGYTHTSVFIVLELDFTPKPFSIADDEFTSTNDRGSRVDFISKFCVSFGKIDYRYGAFKLLRISRKNNNFSAKKPKKVTFKCERTYCDCSIYSCDWQNSRSLSNFIH